MEHLIESLKNKKELRGIKEEFILQLLEEYKKENPKKFNSLVKKEFNPKSKEFEEIKKHIRKKLRDLHGVFQKNKPSQRKQEVYIKQKIFCFYNEKTQKLLKTHRSTNERINYYESTYTEIQKETGKIEKLVDLGCGLNPLSYTLLKELREVFCVDINEEEINFIQKFLNEARIKGEAQILDLTKKENQNIIKEKTKNTDACFLFKTLDGLERIRKGASRDLLNNIKSKNIVVSFSTKTISGKNQISTERKWFQEILQENKYADIIKKKIGEEEYYIIKK